MCKPKTIENILKLIFNVATKHTKMSNFGKGNKFSKKMFFHNMGKFTENVFYLFIFF